MRNTKERGEYATSKVLAIEVEPLDIQQRQPAGYRQVALLPASPHERWRGGEWLPGVYKAQGVHSRWCCGKRAFAFPSTPLLGQEEVA